MQEEKESSPILDITAFMIALTIILAIGMYSYFTKDFRSHKIHEEEEKSVEDRCWAYINNGFFERAIEYAKLGDDKSPSMHFCIGVAYYYNGDLQLALKHLEKAKEMEESIFYRSQHLESIYLYLAKTLRKLGRYDEAIEYYKKSIDIIGKEDNNDKYRDALLEIAKSYEEKGDIDNAIRYYQDAFIYYCDKCYKEKAEIYKKIAELYEKKGDKEKAEKYLNKATELE